MTTIPDSLSGKQAVLFTVVMILVDQKMAVAYWRILSPK